MVPNYLVTKKNNKVFNFTIHRELTVKNTNNIYTMNEWINERTNERTNEWMNEWMNKWMCIYIPYKVPYLKNSLIQHFLPSWIQYFVFLGRGNQSLLCYGKHFFGCLVSTTCSLIFQGGFLCLNLRLRKDSIFITNRKIFMDSSRSWWAYYQQS